MKEVKEVKDVEEVKETPGMLAQVEWVPGIEDCVLL
jgi:hypothetical protein